MQYVLKKINNIFDLFIIINYKYYFFVFIYL